MFTGVCSSTAFMAILPSPSYLELKPLELHNHQVLEAIEQFTPDVVHVLSLPASPVLLFTLRNAACRWSMPKVRSLAFQRHEAPELKRNVHRIEIITHEADKF